MLNIRPVTLDDARVLFNWRNDPLTRKNSRTQDEVPWENHVAWLGKRVRGEVPSCKLYIAEDAGVPVGTVRADEEGGVVEISYTVAPDHRGKGVGKRMVVQFAQTVLPPGTKLKAEIKKGGNESSEHIAKALGLSPVSERASEDPADPRPLVLWQ